jgi:hypothetical protein
MIRLGRQWGGAAHPVVVDMPCAEFQDGVVEGSKLNNKERDLGFLSLSERVDARERGTGFGF